MIQVYGCKVVQGGKIENEENGLIKDFFSGE